YKINWLTCYKIRPYVDAHWGSCLTCATVCPFTKPNVWWRSLTVWALSTCPVPARPILVRALKAIDDRFWGVTRQTRVRWIGYDSGIKPGGQRGPGPAGPRGPGPDPAPARAGTAATSRRPRRTPT